MDRGTHSGDAGRARLVDAIVPPPWSSSRRLLVALPTLLAVAALSLLWWAGVFGPNLGPVRGLAWGPVEPAQVPDGADGLVEVELRIDNRGWLPVEIHDVWAPPFTGAHVRFDEVVVIPARDEATLRFAFVVDQCDRLRAAPWPGVSVTATSGVATVHGRGLRFIGAHGQQAGWDGAPEPDQSSWWYALAESVCDPAFLAP